jgi:hypothetical protein
MKLLLTLLITSALAIAIIVHFAITFDHTSADAATISPKPDYDSMCIVGQEYTVCNKFDLNNEDPFQQGRGRHRVIITDKQRGYVQYAEVGSTVDIFYSRSCEDFIQLTEDCN